MAVHCIVCSNGFGCALHYLQQRFWHVLRVEKAVDLHSDLRCCTSSTVRLKIHPTLPLVPRAGEAGGKCAGWTPDYCPPCCAAPLGRGMLHWSAQYAALSLGQSLVLLA